MSNGSDEIALVWLADLAAAAAGSDTDAFAVCQQPGGCSSGEPLVRMTLAQLKAYLSVPPNLASDIATLQSDVATIKARTQVADSTLTINPPNTSSTAFITAGIGVQFTPQSSTRAIVILDGELGNTGNGNPSDFQLLYGQGVAPPYGTLVTATNGIYIGGQVNMVASRPNDLNPFSVSALLTGLVSGNQYWIGACFRAEQGTATLSQMSLTIFEVLDPLP
jgi:hypothetical protein